MKPIFSSLLLSIPLGLFASSITVDIPSGGWRFSDNDERTYTQVINYPASSVNTEDQDPSSLIRGKITSHPKAKPAKLIINGVAMPLRIDDGGTFERPYAFTKGSNGIEIRSNDGSVKKQVQFYDANPDKIQANLRVVLAWSSDGSDLDLHIISPDGDHTYYGNNTSQNGGSLDIDVTTGYGPEIYSNPTPPQGVYHIYVNYYGSGSDNANLTIAQVAIITQEGTLNEKKQLFQIPLRKEGELTHVHSFSYP